MTTTPPSTSFTNGEMIEKFNDLLSMLDYLIAVSHGNDKYIYKQVRKGVQLSRLKLIYQINDPRGLAEDVEIYRDEVAWEIAQIVIDRNKRKRH